VPGKPLVYGQSITDACIGWEDSVPRLKNLAEPCASAAGKPKNPSNNRDNRDRHVFFSFEPRKRRSGRIDKRGLSPVFWGPSALILGSSCGCPRSSLHRDEAYSSSG